MLLSVSLKMRREREFNFKFQLTDHDFNMRGPAEAQEMHNMTRLVDQGLPNFLDRNLQNKYHNIPRPTTIKSNSRLL